MIVKCEILTPSFTEIEITETMIKELYNKFRDNNKVLDAIIEYIQEEVGGTPALRRTTHARPALR